MRQRFEQQTSLGITPISEVKLPLKSRDELPQVLMALQYIFVTPELNEKFFSLLENKICSDKKKTGRKGMDLWHIIVLAIVRQALDTNWDRLECIANYDGLTRQILGVHANQFNEEDELEFSYQSIIDNVSVINEELLMEINTLVATHGRQLLKKKENEEIKLKTDSFVLETNVHFPTDLNLLWDSLRKGLDTTSAIKALSNLQGWRKINCIRSQTKSIFRATSQQVFRGKDESQKKQKVNEYINVAKALHKRFVEIIINPPSTVLPETLVKLIIDLMRYNDFIKKFIDQIERRLIKDEKIDASEKIYSIFETHTEWISKGKLNRSVELGHLLLITTDQHHFIVDYKVMEGEKDAPQIKPLSERIQKLYPNKTIYSHSFDKGFFSKENLQILRQGKVENIILPKKGKLNKGEKERESTKEFKTLRNAHSAVESNINMLEHHGLNRCPDKGLHGYKRYVGLSVLAYNLHILGNHLKAEARKKEALLQKQRERYRQAA